eukprot:359821-Chlamydomonas_euryale.AAC.14
MCAKATRPPNTPNEHQGLGFAARLLQAAHGYSRSARPAQPRAPPEHGIGSKHNFFIVRCAVPASARDECMRKSRLAGTSSSDSRSKVAKTVRQQHST